MGSSPRSALNWMPRSHLKKIIIGLVILMIALVSTVNIEVEYYTWKNRLDLEVSDLHMITTGSSSSLKPTTSIPFASVLWHVTQAVKVCDLSNSDRMCDAKMSKDYDYDELGLKAQEWLQSDRFSQIVDQNEVIVKLDDDTIVSKDVLDDLVDAFIKSDCKFAGAIRQTDGFFWSSGPLFLVKTDYLKQQLRDNGAVLQHHKKHEDVQMSALLALQDRKSVCNIDVNTFKHRYYEDNRMLIRYKPYVKC
ncbi:hypothetical protein BG006_001250 [Podila minutissima]|uniref:Uncharacterized protein n=1 Tax=Podila minutissima TaxID=64525 RepID=A0A9P5SCM7_9FUNG|nr:hypothetical protein BG006_001250 [Podila minutissima]